MVEAITSNGQQDSRNNGDQYGNREMKIPPQALHGNICASHVDSRNGNIEHLGRHIDNHISQRQQSDQYAVAKTIKEYLHLPSSVLLE
jgi:hypothetical protein